MKGIYLGVMQRRFLRRCEAIKEPLSESQNEQLEELLIETFGTAPKTFRFEGLRDRPFNPQEVFKGEADPLTLIRLYNRIHSYAFHQRREPGEINWHEYNQVKPTALDALEVYILMNPTTGRGKKFSGIGKTQKRILKEYLIRTGILNEGEKGE